MSVARLVTPRVPPMWFARTGSIIGSGGSGRRWVRGQSFKLTGARF